MHIQSAFTVLCVWANTKSLKAFPWRNSILCRLSRKAVCPPERSCRHPKPDFLLKQTLERKTGAGLDRLAFDARLLLCLPVNGNINTDRVCRFFSQINTAFIRNVVYGKVINEYDILQNLTLVLKKWVTSISWVEQFNIFYRLPNVTYSKLSQSETVRFLILIWCSD